MAEEADTDWSYSYSPVPTLSSGLEKGGYELGGEHTNLLSHPGLRSDATIISSPHLRTRMDPELQARLEGMDTRTRITTDRRQLNGGIRYSERSYQDSGFSEETDIQMNPVTTTYLAQTKSGTIYIEPSDDAKIPLSHYSQPLNMPGSDSSTNDRTLSQRLRSPGGTSTPPSSTTYPHHPLKPGSSSYGSKAGSSKILGGYGSAAGGGAGGCSWRSLAVIFIVLTLAMAATSVFLVVSSRMSTSMREDSQGSAKVCPVIDSSSSIQKITGDSDVGPVLPVPDPHPSLEAAHRNLPPDGSSFREVKLKDKMAVLVPPFGYLNLQFFLQESSHVRYDVWIPRGSSFAVYARRNALPTHTKYSHILLISGYRDTATTLEPSTRNIRSAGTVHKTEEAFMEAGHWFVSVYNDDGEAQPLEVMLTDHGSSGCGGSIANGVCNGNGDCVDGQCKCNPGYDGQFCTQSVCPVLCSGRGDYKNGECVCQPGWKGKECHIRYEECEQPDCSGHGVCEDGICVCIKGYKGEFCQEGDCVDPDCSGHGICVSGECICRSGWAGSDCSRPDAPKTCQPDCSKHGLYSVEKQGCVCERGWTGSSCEVRECSIDCGPHGTCENMACTCDNGWTGDLCQHQECDARCAYHGQCKNGTCLCVRGWNGKHCTLEGCARGCSGHGRCDTDFMGNWGCNCEHGWDGKDCGTRLELQCDDGLDDDDDGLIDCQDPECCSSPACSNNQLCYTVQKPINILLQRQPPAQTASFFQKMRFMIEDGSLQRYSKSSSFNESRAAVIRGQVLTGAGRGLVGVRITREGQTGEGFTMTREDGWFDFLVNGGGSVTLKFGKSPFPPLTKTVFVPWNQVVVLDPVMMLMKPAISTASSSPPCLAHDHVTLQPIVIASQQFPSSVQDGTAVVAESQAVYEVLEIPSTSVKLVHSSPRSKGYLSTIQLQLTPENIPATLTKVHLKITIEGDMFEKTFEADPHLKYTYSWRGINYYRQRVYGTTQVLVRVGYEYQGCKETIWTTRSTKLSGLDLPVSNIGGWDLNIHHRYNFQDGIMYRGDGTNIFLKDAPALIFTTLGDGKRRPYTCPNCDGHDASRQRLLAASDLVSAPDGSLYVADFNLVRRVYPDGGVRTVLQLNATSVAYKYHIAVNPKSGALYVSDPQGYRIIQVIDTDNVRNPQTNWVTIVGGQGQCLPGDELHCGDGGPAQQAQLIHPKGIAVSAEGNIVFVDGTTIRMVDTEGITHTLVSAHLQQRDLKNIPCSGTHDLKDVTLGWPTKLAINPLDNTIHFIDGNVILTLTNNKFLKVSAGRPLHCSRPESSYYNNYAAYTTLVSPQAIAFSSTGQMYIAESDSKRINRISMVDTDGRISVFAGRDSKCNCQEPSCDCTSSTNHLAVHSLFRYISGVACTPEGKVHVSDQANHVVRTIQKQVPGMDASGHYEVYSPEHQETYMFNKFGLHMETRNMATKKTVYKFTYSVSTSSGVLVGVTDFAGGKLSIQRNYAGQVEAIKNPQGEKFILTIDRKHLLRSFAYNVNNSVQFDYDRSKELLRSRTESNGNSFVYDYDRNGRLENVVTPTGEVISLRSDISINGGIVNITRNEHKVSLLIQSSFVQKTSGQHVEVIQKESDKGFTVENQWGHRVRVHTSPYLLLDHAEDLGLAESFPVASAEELLAGRESLNRLSWEYYSSEPGVPQQFAKVGKKLVVNGQPVYTVELLTSAGQQLISADVAAKRIVNITSTADSKVISSSGAAGFPDIHFKYSPIGLLTSWSLGSYEIKYSYDQMGRLKEIQKDGSSGSLQYQYPDSAMAGRSGPSGWSSSPHKIVLPGGAAFSLAHDSAGALESLTTPRGGVHQFRQLILLGSRVLQYTPPWSKDSYSLEYDQGGKLTAKIYPDNHGKVIYNYDNSAMLKSVIGGETAVHYHYLAATSLVKSMDLVDDGFHIKCHYRYNRGSLKEMNVHFLSGNGMSNYTLQYQSDAAGRLSSVQLDIPGQTETVTGFQTDIHNGKLRRIADLQVTHRGPTLLTLEDAAKNFVRELKLDELNRIQAVNLIISGQPLYRVNLEYLPTGLIRSKSVYVSHETINHEYDYDADGRLNMVKHDGVTKFAYGHDVNGNVIKILEGDQQGKLGYDAGDRVTQFGDVEYATYDARGFVMKRGEQRYVYNALGQMVRAFEPGKFQVNFFYDDHRRLIGTQDQRNELVQYIYGQPASPHLVTHVFLPRKDQLTSLIYDENDLLIAIENQGTRYYIGTDTTGTPLAVFTSGGQLVKQIDRTPYGRTVHDSNPGLNIFVDFNGGILIGHTRLLHFGDRVYDPILCQWMTPSWDQLFSSGGKKSAVGDVTTSHVTSPDQLFVYRYRGNNPVNPVVNVVDRLQESDGWLHLLDQDLGNVHGSRYMTSSLADPREIHETVNHHVAASGRSRGPEVKLASEESYLQAQKNLLAATFVQSHKTLAAATSSPLHGHQSPGNTVNFMDRISCRPSVFSPGLLVSVENKGDVSVTLINAESSGGVFQNVFASVLNGARLLDSVAIDPSVEVYNFVKSESRLRNDYDELTRLTGTYNVTKQGLRGGGSQICTESRNTPNNRQQANTNNRRKFTICILYGANLERIARHRVRSGNKVAERAAWRQEIRRVMLGFPGRWSQQERQDLLSTGEVRGYTGERIHSVDKYPHFLGQASNIRLVRERGGGGGRSFV